MFLVFLVVTMSSATIEIFKPEVDGILPHSHHSHKFNLIADSPILRSLFFNQ